MQQAGSKGISKAQVEKLGPSKTSLWIAFWELADEAGDCFVWKGQVTKGRGVFVPNKGPPLPAAHVAWAYDGRELAAGESLEPTCRRKACVRPDHQAVRSSR